jgi:hypothetical protein
MGSTEDKRLTQWNEGRYKQVFELARAGFPEAKMAELMLVKLVTFVSWKKSNPEFLEALQKGRYESNLEVIDALYLSAKGRWIDEDIATYDKTLKKFIHDTKKVFIPPNPWAAARIASLKMRDEGWSETQRIEINQNITNNVNISGMADEILDLIASKLNELPQIENRQDIEDIEFKDVENDQADE